MDVKLKVRRFDPDRGDGSYYQDYRLDVPDYATVLDVLIQVREEIDGTLALRCSCRSAICGSCAMSINSRARLACKTKVVEMLGERNEILVEPGGNMPVIKDLVVDMEPFWDKVRAVKPWLMPVGPEPEREHLVSNESMLDLTKTMNCIMCGACTMACTSLEAEIRAGKPRDQTFLGPAALAKAYRFVADPRDGTHKERLAELSKPTGVWDCTHCFYCIEVCPKDVAPMDRILQLREKAVEAGFTNNSGSRHHKAFIESVEKFGRLDELTLVPKSVGMFNVRELLPQIPGALRLVRAGKLPFPRHSAQNKGKIARIVKKLERKKKEVKS